jgi:glycosyltransferase involved in cell wall biosynthesis
MRIVFFIDSLRSGGKERRLIELLTYLKNKPEFDLMLVLTEKDIHYTKFIELNIPYVVFDRKWFKKNPSLFIKFYKVCKKFRPEIVHTWDFMVTFYSLPAVILKKIPLLNSQITDAPPKIKKWTFFNLISRINFFFSKIILANSIAGIDSYNVNKKKSKIIYNGINLDRFVNLQNTSEVKMHYGIETAYSVIMVASFTDRKDYDKFIDVAKSVNSIRSDISFIAVGGGINFERIKRRVIEEQIPNIIFLGKIKEVENVVSIADIGVLFSTYGEGISNAILEYMALGKPVIAEDIGGTKEIVENGINGILLTNKLPEQIAKIIIDLIDDKSKRNRMGEMGKKQIQEKFTIDKMGKEFEKIYHSINNG